MADEPVPVAEDVRMNSEERRRLADRIERHVWLVVKPTTRDDIDLGQLRVNILDAVDAALWGALTDGPVERENGA